jgi:predicted DCC family thiol-disulfide oxidoreductase YuxK
MDNNEKRTIVFFDGVCNLCSSFVKMILRFEKNETIYFCSLQSPFAMQNLKNRIDVNNLNTVYFWKNEKLYSKSSAIIEIFKTINSWGFVLMIFLILPKVIRDKLYDFIARNRYLWFGKSEKCMIPDKRVIHRFIE